MAAVASCEEIVRAQQAGAQLCRRARGIFVHFSSAAAQHRDRGHGLADGVHDPVALVPDVATASPPNGSRTAFAGEQQEMFDAAREEPASLAQVPGEIAAATALSLAVEAAQPASIDTGCDHLQASRHAAGARVELEDSRAALVRGRRNEARVET